MEVRCRARLTTGQRKRGSAKPNTESATAFLLHHPG
jgi:hypothetical protein